MINFNFNNHRNIRVASHYIVSDSSVVRVLIYLVRIPLSSSKNIILGVMVLYIHVICDTYLDVSGNGGGYHGVCYLYKTSFKITVPSYF